MDWELEASAEKSREEREAREKLLSEQNSPLEMSVPWGDLQALNTLTPEERRRAEHCNALTVAGASTPRIQAMIEGGAWRFLQEHIVDLPTHYAIQQYKDDKNNKIWTLALNREGRVLTILCD